jgi:hypothetical protein
MALLTVPTMLIGAVTMAESAGETISTTGPGVLVSTVTVMSSKAARRPSLALSRRT